MLRVHDARDGADAVRKFAEEVGRCGRSAQRIQARLSGQDGMAALCKVEAVISDLWPASTAKELVWLTRSDAGDGERLHLQAFASDGELLGAVTFRLEDRDA